MASQNTEQEYEAKLAPSVGGEPTSGGPSSSSPDPNPDSSEVLDRHEDQAMGQDPGSQDNSPPEDRNQRVANVEDNHNLFRLSFPRKLWMIVEEDTFKSVSWNDDGDAVIVEKDLFQREVLQRRGAEKIFKTDSLKSFIRQLNLYGFRKTRPSNSPGNEKMMIYRHSNFQRDKPRLLENIQRNDNLRNTAQQATCVPTPKRKELVATRRSLCIYHINARKEGIKMCQRGAPSVQGSSGTQSFRRSGMWFKKRATWHPLGNGPPQEPNGPSGEGTSGNVTFASSATTWMEGTGQVPSSLVYSDNGSVMSLYNICYYVLLASLSVMSPNEPSNNEEEQEGSSDYKCRLCEQFRNNASP
ncbi:heat shock transcription factor, X-linked member 3 [Symphalangus syndactylus]|uniref:heat shock transcription factor, X-linked member 3 n=1 Tax=Symphalangus syndactylus TaxID=9590 RepID=UPI00244260FB|nr:heat shock transcription factor, X-linked member 3 [Symphalangus syndactylus]XP_055125448.1 heat shock transcription factor, X-linked member 3 [Symphalangus syndactylus]